MLGFEWKLRFSQCSLQTPMGPQYSFKKFSKSKLVTKKPVGILIILHLQINMGRNKILKMNLQTHEQGTPLFQFSSVAQPCLTLCDPVNCSTPGLPVPHQLPEFTQTHIHELLMPSSHLILCRPLFLLPPIPPSITVFSNESTLHMRWPKYWSFSFNISPSNEHPELISFRMHWLDLLAFQRTLKSPLQLHSSKASILWWSPFFTVQLSHPYMTTGKTIALTRWTCVDKVMSLLFNMLCRLVITFLPRSKGLLISWLQSPSAVILEPPKIKSDTVSPSISQEGTRCHDLSFLNVEL